MATLIVEERILPAWHKAAMHLLQTSGHMCFNILLEITNPLLVTPEDGEFVKSVDQAIRNNCENTSISTVANTIFPNDVYRKHGRPEFYEKYLETMSRAMKPGTWGTYAHRLISYPIKKGDETINPLEGVVQKFIDIETGITKKRFNFYEVSPLAPPDEKEILVSAGAEVPLYIPSFDANKPSNIPCLSHLTFKFVPESGSINLTAIYRSHYYCNRALGNLIGLHNLLNFVASESKLKVGTLSCLSSHARLDAGSFGGMAKTRKLLQSYANNGES